MTDQGTTYSGFVEAELNAERERRATFDAWGQTLITTAGTVVAIMTGLAAFVGATTAVPFPHRAVWFLAGALLALAFATACGIVAGWNYIYDVATPSMLKKMIGDQWTDDEINAPNHVATVQIGTIAALRKGNNRKARWIATGQIALLFALIALGVVVYLIVRAL